MSSPRKKRDNLSVLKVYLSFIHINTTLKKMAHGIHDIKVILMYTNGQFVFFFDGWVIYFLNFIGISEKIL